MKTFFFTLFFALSVTLFSTSYNAFAGTTKLDIKSELSEAEIRQVEGREFVVRTKDVPGSAWPEITYYALINAPALEAVGLFAAYDIQKDYTPNLLKSTPVKHVSPTDVQTEYELQIPFPLSNAKYIHGAKIFKHADDYEVEWYMVESSSSEDVRGSAYFQNDNGKTLLRYRTYVKPKSIFGSFVKKVMFKDVEKSIIAICSFIERTVKENPTLSSKYSEFITRALRGEFVYQTIIDKK